MKIVCSRLRISSSFINITDCPIRIRDIVSKYNYEYFFYQSFNAWLVKKTIWKQKKLLTCFDLINDNNNMIHTWGLKSKKYSGRNGHGKPHLHVPALSKYSLISPILVNVAPDGLEMEKKEREKLIDYCTFFECVVGNL